LIFYSHPDDRGFGSGFICKMVLILGMSLSWVQVLLLPLDVMNTRGFMGQLEMDKIWIICYIIIAAFIIFIIPACSYYYEADSEFSSV